MAYYRARCLTCHTGEAMATQHHPEQKDCTSCHMPRRATSDISHEQVTDHDIEVRWPEARGARSEELVTVGGVAATEAEFGMAYAQMTGRGGEAYGREALRRLQRAAGTAGTGTTGTGGLEPAMEAELGYLLQVSGQAEAARAAYARALENDPYQATALGDLGVLDAGTGRLAEGVGLLERLVKADPSQTVAGLNLALIECKLGRPEAALALMEQLRRVNPDDPQLREFQRHGSYAGSHCDLGRHGTN